MESIEYFVHRITGPEKLRFTWKLPDIVYSTRNVILDISIVFYRACILSYRAYILSYRSCILSYRAWILSYRVSGFPFSIVFCVYQVCKTNPSKHFTSGQYRPIMVNNIGPTPILQSGSTSARCRNWHRADIGLLWSTISARHRPPISARHRFCKVDLHRPDVDTDIGPTSALIGPLSIIYLKFIHIGPWISFSFLCKSFLKSCALISTNKSVVAFSLLYFNDKI
jgi:hypothetical protein